MKFNKQLVIILILGSLLMSALGAALYFYQMNQQTIEDSNKKVKVFIAKEKIERNKQIQKSDIKEHFVTKQEVLTRPLHLKEIVGKFSKIDIYKNEMFIKEKISDTLPEDTDKKFIEFKNNSYNMAFKLFQNPNYTLQKGDTINIITSYQSTQSQLPDYTSQYVAKGIKVLGFIERGLPVAKPINRKKIKKTVKKKQIEVVEDVKADEIVLDIKDKTLLDIAHDFQKKKNLFWMVKTKSKMKKTAKVAKKSTPSSVKKKVVKRSYPFKWYIPSRTSKAAQATIQYADKPDAPLVKNATLVFDYEKACQEKSQLLLGLSRNVYLKSRPSLKAKTVKKVYRNYILAYKEKVDSWYKLCDNNYVHQNEVRTISHEYVMQKMKKTKK